jgi:hypothetical protein
MNLNELRRMAENAEVQLDGKKLLILVLARTDRGRQRMRLAGRDGGPSGRVLGPTMDGRGTTCLFDADEILLWLDRLKMQ